MDGYGAVVKAPNYLVKNLGVRLNNDWECEQVDVLTIDVFVAVARPIWIVAVSASLCNYVDKLVDSFVRVFRGCDTPH